MDGAGPRGREQPAGASGFDGVAGAPGALAVGEKGAVQTGLAGRARLSHLATGRRADLRGLTDWPVLSFKFYLTGHPLMSLNYHRTGVRLPTGIWSRSEGRLKRAQ